MDSLAIIQSLQNIGFSQNEAKVYVQLVKKGSSKAGKIAKDTDLDRSSVYKALQTLITKGMVSYVTIGKVKWFQCSDPKNIITHLNNKVEAAKEFIPEIDKIRKDTKLAENVRLFKGLKGIKTVFEDIIRNADENLIFGSEGQFSKNMPNFEKKFSKRMKNKGIKVKSIIRTNRELKEKEKKANVRKIPSSVESPVVTNIYKDKIAVIIWSEDPEAILIQNQKAADAYKEYFKFIWKHAEK